MIKTRKVLPVLSATAKREGDEYLRSAQEILDELHPPENNRLEHMVGREGI